MNSRSEMMETMPIRQLLIRFSIPTIVGMLVNGLYNIVDRIFLGQAVSRMAIGGVYLAFPIMILSMAFAMLIGFGGNALSSIELGRHNKEKAEDILNNALILLFFAGLILGILFFFFMEPLLLLFGGSETLLPYATEYLQIILLFLPIYQIQFGLNAFTRGEGNPKISMFTMLIGAGVNTVLDYIFIVRLGWGVAGAAWATGIGQTCSFIWVMHYFTRGDSTLKLHWPLRLKTELILPTLKLGTSSFGIQVMASLITVIYNTQLQRYGGDGAVATMGIFQSIVTLMMMPVIGLGQGAQPIMGYNYGARQYDRIREALKHAIIIATTYLTIFWIFIMWRPDFFIGIFGKDNAGMDLPAMMKAMRYHFLIIPVVGSQMIGSIYFQATEKPFLGLVMSLSRQLLILLPCLYILASLFHLNGIWIAASVSDFFAFVLTMVFLKRDMKRLDRLEECFCEEKVDMA